MPPSLPPWELREFTGQFSTIWMRDTGAQGQLSFAALQAPEFTDIWSSVPAIWQDRVSQLLGQASINISVALLAGTSPSPPPPMTPGRRQLQSSAGVELDTSSCSSVNETSLVTVVFEIPSGPDGDILFGYVSVVLQALTANPSRPVYYACSNLVTSALLSQPPLMPSPPLLPTLISNATASALTNGANGGSSNGVIVAAVIGICCCCCCWLLLLLLWLRRRSKKEKERESDRERWCYGSMGDFSVAGTSPHLNKEPPALHTQYITEGAVQRVASLSLRGQTHTINETSIVRVDSSTPIADQEVVVATRVMVSADRAPAMRWLHRQAECGSDAETDRPLDVQDASAIQTLTQSPSETVQPSPIIRSLKAKLSFSRAARQRDAGPTSPAGSAALMRARRGIKPGGNDAADMRI